MFTTGQSIRAAVGTSLWWNVPSPLGFCLLLLALFPTDARAIRVVCSTCLVLHVHGAWDARTRLNTRGRPARSTRLPKCCVVPRCRHRARTHALRCGGYRAMQPRPALRRLWAVIRLFWLGYGVLLAGYNIADYAQGGSSFDHRALAIRWGDPRCAGELAGTATGYAFVVHGFACLVCCLEAC
eukprot:scaffold52574_cov78-Phaeocystis_antarctica.AAC.2